MEDLEYDLEEILKVWPVVSKAICTIQTEPQYRQTVKLLDKTIL